MASLPATAQDWDCANADNLPQQGMNYCAWKDYETADAELNAVWKEVFPQIKVRDAEMPEEMQGWPDAVRNAQRAWIEYRDGHCESEGFVARGGTLEPLLVATCKAHMTRERTKELKQLIEVY